MFADDLPGPPGARAATYSGSDLLPAAMMLLSNDLRRDAIEGALQLSPRIPTRPGDPLEERVLTVDWKRILRRNRSDGTLVLATVARSMLEGTPIDLRSLVDLDVNHRGVLAASFELLARPTRRS